MTVSEIPLSATPQSFVVTLSGTTYKLTFTYRRGWLMDIADVGGAPILQGCPLVQGHDLLEQYKYLGIPGQMWVVSREDPPAFDALGDTARLYYVS